jgi:Catalase
VDAVCAERLGMSAQPNPGQGWKEVPLGGSQAREDELIRRFASAMNHIQSLVKAHQHAPVIRRGQHAKILAGVTNAEFRIADDVPEDLRIGLFEPGATYRATVRLSNCNGLVEPDSKRDLRGLALRVFVNEAAAQDFLATNAPASHARTPVQFMVVARAFASRTRIVTFLRLLFGLGPFETVRVLRVLNAGTSRHVTSLATERFWSRCPIAFGACALKYTFEPVDVAPSTEAATGDDYLRDELTERLRRGPVRFGFRVERFVDERTTPIEDGTVHWKPAAAPETIATLEIPRQDLTTSDSRQSAERVDGLDFTPWNCVEGLRPIGSMNRARRWVYEASQAYRAPGGERGGQ